MALLFLPCLLTPYKSWTPSGPRDPLKYHPLCTKTTHEKATFSVLYFAQLSMSFPSMTFNSFRHPKFLEIESLSKSLLLLSPKLRRLRPWSISSLILCASCWAKYFNVRAERKSRQPNRETGWCMVFKHGMFQQNSNLFACKHFRGRTLPDLLFGWFFGREI